MSASEHDSQTIPLYGVTLGGEFPSLLADVSSIVLDLAFAAETFARIGDDLSDPLVRRALWDAGTVAYRRGFSTGRSLIDSKRARTRVPEQLLDSLDEDGRTMHDRILREANQHIAHRVSDLEQARVILLLANPVLSRKVLGVGPFTVRYLGPVTTDARLAAQVAANLRDAMAQQQQLLQQLMIEKAQEREVEEWYRDAFAMDGVDGHPAVPTPEG